MSSDSDTSISETAGNENENNSSEVLDASWLSDATWATPTQFDVLAKSSTCTLDLVSMKLQNLGNPLPVGKTSRRAAIDQLRRVLQEHAYDVPVTDSIESIASAASALLKRKRTEEEDKTGSSSCLSYSASSSSAAVAAAAVPLPRKRVAKPAAVLVPSPATTNVTKPTGTTATTTHASQLSAATTTLSAAAESLALVGNPAAASSSIPTAGLNSSSSSFSSSSSSNTASASSAAARILSAAGGVGGGAGRVEPVFNVNAMVRDAQVRTGIALAAEKYEKRWVPVSDGGWQFHRALSVVEKRAWKPGQLWISVADITSDLTADLLVTLPFSVYVVVAIRETTVQLDYCGAGGGPNTTRNVNNTNNNKDYKGTHSILYPPRALVVSGEMGMLIAAKFGLESKIRQLRDPTTRPDSSGLPADGGALLSAAATAHSLLLSSTTPTALSASTSSAGGGGGAAGGGSTVGLAVGAGIVGRPAAGDALDSVVDGSGGMGSMPARNLLPEKMSRKQWEEHYDFRTSGMHLPKKHGQQIKVVSLEGKLKHKDSRGDCRVCGRKTTWRCRRCDVNLCISDRNDKDCMYKFHTLIYFPDKEDAQD